MGPPGLAAFALERKSCCSHPMRYWLLLLAVLAVVGCAATLPSTTPLGTGPLAEPEVLDESGCARGKIALIEGLSENSLSLSHGFSDRLSKCLNCKSCMRPVPAG